MIEGNGRRNVITKRLKLLIRIGVILTTGDAVDATTGKAANNSSKDRN
jgi:hypothetical protein